MDRPGLTFTPGFCSAVTFLLFHTHTIIIYTYMIQKLYFYIFMYIDILSSTPLTLQYLSKLLRFRNPSPQNILIC